MAIPKQIRKQSEAVQELYQQLNQNVEESGEVQETAQAQGDSISDETVAEDQQQEAVEVQEADNNVSEDAAPSSEPEQKTDDEKVSDEAILQKYKTLQGMYNAEVPRLHAQNKEMQQKLQHMQQLLASLSPQQSGTNPQPVEAEKLISEKDQEEYGESIDVMRKVTREELGSVAQRIAQLERYLHQLQSSVVPQVEAVAQKQAASSEQAFWSDLSNAVPNWREVNDDQGFQSWLLETDPLTGISRQTYLEDAQRSLDSRRVASFFRTWLENNGQAAVARPEKSAKTQSPELEKQVAPGRSKNSGTPKANNGRVYTPQDIQKFFDDVRQGKYKGRESERDKIERDIFAAQRENRIQVNA
jgi:hypothetical protein